MKVTIITVCYNSASTIRLTLDSVKNQSYDNIEHIIIDGGSTDATIDIVNEYDHVAKLVSEPDNGIYDAMNKGISMSNGEMIALLNSDDVYCDQLVIEKVVQTFEQNKDIDIVYGNTIAGHFDTAGNLTRITREVRPGAFDKSNFLKGWMPSHVSVFINKNVYDRFGLFSTDFKIGADYELLLRFMYKEGVPSRYVDLNCVNFRIGGVSTSSISNRLLMVKESKKAWKMNHVTPKIYTIYYKPVLGLMNVIRTKFNFKK